MRKWKKPVDCEWQKSGCDCESIKSTTCHNCESYYPSDSGYGWCKALPKFQLVAWCRDVCVLFRKEIR